MNRRTTLLRERKQALTKPSAQLVLLEAMATIDIGLGHRRTSGSDSEGDGRHCAEEVPSTVVRPVRDGLPQVC